MNCEKYAYLIDDLIEGELDEQAAEQVNLHIFACPHCNSQYKLLEREKEMYSHFLFEIEPPIDLLTQFQTKLEIEKQPAILAANGNFITKIFAFLRFNPALAIATALILFVIGFGLLNLVKEEKTFEKAVTAQNIQLILPQIDKKEDTAVEKEKVDDSSKLENQKPELNPKPLLIKQKVKKAEPSSKIVSKTPQLSEEEQQIKEVQALEIETAKQIEKVELLLRSFRNARLIEGSEIYDISFEKQQARKLLQTNFVLRQRAESYGLTYTEEMLSKVEPYLLDIANLALSPAPEQVLEIKERVRNQNIIASLQGF